MGGENELYGLLSAYALGCLDKGDLVKLKDYLAGGGDYPWQELGEYQNLASLLPSILNMEIPAPQLKDKVARKLYRIKDEKRLKRTSASTMGDGSSTAGGKTFTRVTSTGERLVPPVKLTHNDEEFPEYHRTSEEDIISESLKKSAEDNLPPVYDFEVVTSRKQTEPEPIDNNSEESSAPEDLSELSSEAHFESAEENSGFVEEREVVDLREEKTPGKAPELRNAEAKKKPYTLHGGFETKPEKKSHTGLIVAILAVLLIAAGVVFVYLRITSDVKVYKTSVEQLNSQIKDLTKKVAGNQALQKLLLTKNVRIINLTGTKLSQDGFGKLIISFDNSRAYLQLSQMPDPPNNGSYQLWAEISGKYVSLGIFKPTDDVNYFPFTVPELTNKTTTKFIVTGEPEGGAQKPGRDLYLTGDL